MVERVFYHKHMEEFRDKHFLPAKSENPMMVQYCNAIRMRLPRWKGLVNVMAADHIQCIYVGEPQGT